MLELDTLEMAPKQLCGSQPLLTKPHTTPSRGRGVFTKARERRRLLEAPNEPHVVCQAYNTVLTVIRSKRLF